jgi:catechol 2,3-dioxygenase-like lactoylglutathione lyase family enzyme
MTIVLNHTVVRARNKQRSARFFADLLGLVAGDPVGPFAPVSTMVMDCAVVVEGSSVERLSARTRARLVNPQPR